MNETTPTERVARLTYVMTLGRSMTTREAAELLEVSVRTAQRTFAAISRTVPLIREDDGRWAVVDDRVKISPY